MSSKAKAEAKVPILKGQEAEDKILGYMKKMNRPFGAVDVAANLKGAVPKATTQKILVSLAEKGHLVQKTYGKTTFFVINQASLELVPADVFSNLQSEYKVIDDANKLLAATVKVANLELTKLKAAPSDLELDDQVKNVTATVTSLTARLDPLRSGVPLVSEKELALIDTDWAKWRAEWLTRRKVFMTFWQMVTDSLPPQESASLAEDLGIEMDSAEHLALERSHLCVCSKSTNPLKRKR